MSACLQFDRILKYVKAPLPTLKVVKEAFTYFFTSQGLITHARKAWGVRLGGRGACGFCFI